jgi:sialate O-acetylesterase
MIKPLRYYTSKGFIWYQGEHNVQEYRYYDLMMQEMVTDWRKIWNDETDSMPFYYVQIAPWRYFNNSKGIERPLLVEAQVKALSLIKNSGMATTTDLGEELCIHPSKKREVGQRLAACALEQIYQISGLHSNVFVEKKIEYNDSLVFLSFPTLQLGTSPSSYMGFEVAGEDKIFYSAEAKLDKNRIRITSDKVKHPVALRYAFRNYVEATMKNTMGIPFCSFRTDSW